MAASNPLIGTWVTAPKSGVANYSQPECILHVVDDNTCVFVEQTARGQMISWFQYWPHDDGILRYPLTNATRPMFKNAEYIPILIEENKLTINGHRVDRVETLPIPERYDVLPGTRPDENGNQVSMNIRSKVREHLSYPPKGEQHGVE